jgi:hypothetical protein
MPFCSSCGATVAGAFCSQCGTGATGQTTAAPVPLPARRKTSPLVWILAAIGGVILLVIIGLFAAGFYMARNPEAVWAKLVNLANPNAEVLSVDNTSKQITIRDKRNGKQVTVSFDDLRSGRFRLSATDENGNVGRIEVGAGSGKLPGWLPTYPDAKIQSQVTGVGDAGRESVEGGMYTFTTRDEPARVTSFYQEKCRDLGMTVDLSMATSDGGKIAARDEDGNRTLVVLFAGASSDGTTVTVTFKRKR